MADGHGIVVVAMAAESQFPDGIRFSITARSSEEIDDIRVHFRTIGASRGSAYRVVEFEPGTEVTGEVLLRSGGAGFIPPGTRIKYSFEVRDKGGGELRTPDQEFTYLDNRFEWETLSSGPVTVYSYGDKADQQLKVVLATAQATLERMAPVLGFELTEPFSIVSYPSYSDMTAAIPFRAQAVSDQLITEGLAFTDERVLLVHSGDARVEATVSHEFTHLLVAEATGHIRGELPAWLNEGLAEFGNIDTNQGYDAALRRGINSNRVNPLWYQRRFGGTPDDIIIAYGQASSVV